MISLHALPDLPKSVRERIYIVRFEDMMRQPVECMAGIYAWLGVSPLQIDPTKLTTGIRESDSHYRMKYTHTQATQILPPKLHEIPPRIQRQIETACAWFYQTYYPKAPQA